MGGSGGEPNTTDREIRSERILHWRQLVIRCARRGSPTGGRKANRHRPCGRLRSLRENRAAVLEEDQQVGGAVVIHVDYGTHLLARRRIELLYNIDAVVEVAIHLAAHEGAALVIFVNIRSAVEVRVDGDLGQLVLTIVRPPD